MSQQYFETDLVAPRGEFIRRISVNGLFDEWTYNKLESSQTYGRRLAILAGPNGSGKTTLLHLLRAALSERPGRHKSIVYEITFERFDVELINGLCLGFRRPRPMSGPFEYFVQRPAEGERLSLPFGALSSNRNIDHEETELTPDTPEEGVTLEAISKILHESAPHIVYLPTYREGRLSPAPPSHEFVDRDSRHDPLSESVNAFMRRLQIRARRESNDAEVAAFDVLARTIDIALSGESKPPSRETLLSLFKDQMLRTSQYSALGLTTRVSADSVIARIQTASEPQFGMIAAMVRPYLESQRARLDSVKDTFELVSQFIDSINSFIYPKTVTVNLLDHLRVFKNRDRLALSALSSGERQLLRMFTSVTALGPRPSLVLIDEPELSLNANWTRLLVRRLLSETLTDGTQFFLATHSIELMSQFDDAVIELKQ